MLYCSCGFNKAPGEEENTEITEKVVQKRKIEVMEQLDTHPKIKIPCDKCGNGFAFYWTQQTRGADEPETRFFKCTKCNHTWREYA